MQKLNALIDAARNNCDRDSDRAVAKALKVTGTTILGWRDGSRRITDEHLAALIELAKADPADALKVREEMATTKAEKRLWNHMLVKLAAAAFVMGMHIMLSAGMYASRRKAETAKKRFGSQKVNVVVVDLADWHARHFGSAAG